MDGRAYLGEILKNLGCREKNLNRSSSAEMETRDRNCKKLSGIHDASPVFTMRILWCWPRCDNDWAKKVAASVASFDTFHALSAQHQLSRFAESCVAKSNVRVRDGMKDTFGCWLMVASEVLDLFYVGLPKNRDTPIYGNSVNMLSNRVFFCALRCIAFFGGTNPWDGGPQPPKRVCLETKSRNLMLVDHHIPKMMWFQALFFAVKPCSGLVHPLHL